MTDQTPPDVEPTEAVPEEVVTVDESAEEVSEEVADVIPGAPPPKPAKKVIKDVTNEPCGCVKTLFADETGSVDPCDGHAMAEVAAGLKHAANIAEMMGHRWVKENQQKAMMDIAKRLQQGTGPKKIIRS